MLPFSDINTWTNLRLHISKVFFTLFFHLYHFTRFDRCSFDCVILLHNLLRPTCISTNQHQFYNYERVDDNVHWLIYSFSYCYPMTWLTKCQIETCIFKLSGSPWWGGGCVAQTPWWCLGQTLNILYNVYENILAMQLVNCDFVVLFCTCNIFCMSVRSGRGIPLLWLFLRFPPFLFPPVKRVIFSMWQV